MRRLIIGLAIGALLGGAPGVLAARKIEPSFDHNEFKAIAPGDLLEVDCEAFRGDERATRLTVAHKGRHGDEAFFVLRCEYK